MTTTAREIAARAKAAFTDMADTWEHATDADGDTKRRLATLLRTGAAWPIGPRAVTATVIGPDTELWGHYASDALDIAGENLPDTADIKELSPGAWVITW